MWPDYSCSYLVVHLFRAVEHVHHDAERATQVLRRFSLSGSGRPSWCAAHGQVERLREGDVAPVGEGRDDESWSVAEVFVRVTELRVTDVCEAILLFLVPAMTQLTQPREGLHTTS